MNTKLPTRRIGEHADLEQLERQAKELQDANGCTLDDAQLELARAYGFASWPKLKAFVDGITIRRLADAIRAVDVPLVRSMLESRRELAGMTMSYGDEHRPIHFAVMQRSSELVRILMRAGANAREGIHPHRDATTALVIARDRGYDELVAIIEEEERGRTPAAKDDESDPPTTIHGDEEARAAVARGDIEWLRSRHAAGKLTPFVRQDGGGLLTVAVEHDQPEILTLLLGYGFDPDERVSYGEGDWISFSQALPLWRAAARGRTDLAEILLANGANPNAHVDSSGSPVYSAFSHKQWAMAELLQRRGGLVSADIAAIYRKTDLGRRMLNDDARGMLAPGIVTSDKPLAVELLGFAADGAATEIVRMALERIDWPLDDARWFRALCNPLCFWHHIPWLYAGNKEFDRQGYLDSFRLILARSGPNPIGGFQRTALHEVASMGSWVTQAEAAAFAAALLEAGARMDVRDAILQSTPLGWACRWGRIEVARALLEHGADSIEPEAERWATPFAWARKRGHDEIVALLESRELR